MGTDLIEWLGVQSLTSETEAHANRLVLSATARFNRYAHPDSLPSDPDDCPDDAFTAIIMAAARDLMRRSSANGVVMIGDVGVNISKLDPDVSKHEAAFFNWPEPY